MDSTPSTQTAGLPRPRTPLRTALTLCLLSTAISMPAQAPATAAPATATPAAPATTSAATTTKVLPTQPASKPISRRQALKASDAFLAGSAYLEKNEPEKALKEFERAAALYPEKQQYTTAAAIARENVVGAMVRKAQVLRSTGDNTAAAALLVAAEKIDPQNPLVTEHLQSVSEPVIDILPNTVINNGKLQTLAAPLELVPDQTMQSFHLRADAHEMMRRVLLSYGLKAQFAPDAPSASVRLDIDNVSFQQVLPILQQLTGSFIAPLDAKTALVLKETRENHDQYDHLSLETIYMPGFTTAQMTDASNLLKQVLEIEHVTVNAASGTISLRAPQQMLRIANYELADLLDGGNEVLLDMRIYTITKSNTKDIGFAAGTTLSATNLYSAEQSALSQYKTQINAAIAAGTLSANTSDLVIFEYLLSSGLLSSNTLASGQFLGTIGKGTTWTGVTATNLPTFNFGLNYSEAKSLDEIQLRVGDRQTATFRAGSRYPVTTGTYSSSISTSELSSLTSAQLAALGYSSLAAAESALSSATVPEVQYEDLGMTLKAVPTVLRAGSVSIAIDLKIEALAGSSLDDIPILSSRSLTSTVTVAPGQIALIVSNMTRQESRAVSGLPGLAELPGFQSVTSDDTNGLDTSELVISLTPRLVRHGRDRIASQPIAFPRAAAKESGKDEE